MITPETITVVLRYSGERTVDRCKTLIEKEVEKDHIVAISEAPFSKALTRSFEIGIERNRPWTLTVDADVLLRSDAISELLRIGEQLDENVFEVQGNILDKFSGGPRPGGPKLFRTALLKAALKHIPPRNSATRPEGHTIQRMASQGFPCLMIDAIFGLHDHEQWNRDIYRKAFFHTHKFAPAVQHYWLPLWERMSSEDPDFQIALIGADAGRKFAGAVRSDVHQFSLDEIDRLLSENGFQEKNKLDPNRLPREDIDNYVRTFFPLSEYWAWMSRSRETRGKKRSFDTFQSGLKRTGWTRIVPWMLGGVMSTFGRKMQDWAKQKYCD